jgi:hypothetical protein
VNTNAKVDRAIQYMGDSKISSAERDVLLRDGGHALDVSQVLALAEKAEEVHAEFYGWIKPRMTRERAEQIRRLRVDLSWSYRRIAGMSYLEWGRDGNWHPETNQLAGVALCEAAAELLGEDVQNYPWQANLA